MDNFWLWAVVALLLIAAGVLVWLRSRLAPVPAALNPDDRFSPSPAISPVEMELLDYLVRAFPGRPVLFRSALSHLVSVRKARNRMAAQQQLSAHFVDYVVCNREGKPVYAFELDARHADPEEAARDALEKHRVFKTAGIRLIRLKRSTRDLPPPHDFRRQLRAATLPQNGSKEAPPAGDTSADAVDGHDRSSRKGRLVLADGDRMIRTGFRDTVPMTLTGLMDLPPVPDDVPDDLPGDNDPWGASQRTG